MPGDGAVAALHNVRNALTPIGAILSAGMPAPRVDRATIERALAELAQADVAAERRERLAAFVAAAVAAEAEARDTTAGALRAGCDAMRDVLAIIDREQAAAHAAPRPERCDLAAIVARHAAVLCHAYGGRIAVSVSGGGVEASADPAMLGQVIGNLLANAVEAIVATGRGEGAVAVAVAQDADEVSVRIHDDGEGFDPAAAATLLLRGVSTRTHKHGGLGLDWCVQAMRAMNGSLRLDSRGAGEGATATLTLPAAAPRACAA